jgi:hypothetical protein
MSDKDTPKLSTNKEVVIPIFDGKVQEETTLEQYVRDLGNKRPNNWSIIS